jgi:rubredoxin
MTEFRELIPYEACPLCGGSRIEPTVRADCSAHPAFAEPLSRTMEWMRCADCGHVFRNGFYTPEAFEILFRSSLAGQRVGEDYERQRNIAAAMIERILPLRKTGIWLCRVRQCLPAADRGRIRIRAVGFCDSGMSTHCGPSASASRPTSPRPR